jgi:hypothetical protein
VSSPSSKPFSQPASLTAIVLANPDANAIEMTWKVEGGETPVNLTMTLLLESQANSNIAVIGDV